jgi:hypothetical protein
MSIYWHLLILIPLISLVYSATRFDDWPVILHEAWRWGIRMGGFLAAIGVIILILAYVTPTVRFF